jgi:hypothetical protein
LFRVRNEVGQLTTACSGRRSRAAADAGRKKETPYTDALIKRAITDGLDPGGEPLDWTMPRWQIGDTDFADLLAYLRTLR